MKESGAKPIPTRHVVINNNNDLPDKYSSTPGGTLFSTTPGGTRIIYDRQFLMHLRSSPYAKSPPKMCYVAGVTNIPPTHAEQEVPLKKNLSKNANCDEAQFDIEF